MQITVRRHQHIFDFEFGDNLRGAYARDDDPEISRESAGSTIVEIFQRNHLTYRAPRNQSLPASELIGARLSSTCAASSKKSTSPVSSEYSAPTTSRPSFWINCSMISEPCRK